MGRVRLGQKQEATAGCVNNGGHGANTWKEVVKTIKTGQQRLPKSLMNETYSCGLYAASGSYTKKLLSSLLDPPDCFRGV